MEFEIIKALEKILIELYQTEIKIENSTIQRTKKEFEGDYTIVVFPFVKMAKKSPEQIGNEIGAALVEKLPTLISGFNVVKGFLNLSISRKYWIEYLQRSITEGIEFHNGDHQDQITLIEYSSPNTNKPLHLGHVRNNLLGASVANILEAVGKKVYRVNLVNDRGIHICKSMLAWQKFGNGETPANSGLKGDHLVGKYYVIFDQHYKKEIQALVEQGTAEEIAKKTAPLMLEAQEMLRKWEDNDSEVRSLWEQLNGWVYDGFEKTYSRLGIRFDKTYYESDTYLSGKALVEEGLQKGELYQKEDGSVWVDLTDEGLDEKLLLRSDGTSVYMTQDLGTAQLRYNEYQPGEMIYVVGNEQNYHFDVLKLVLSKKLHKSFGDKIYHLSYGMVELPQGKMKSREGTVVDADDLMQNMYQEAKTSTEELGKFNFDENEASKLYEMIGMGALKYFILKVDPKKNMLFNPAESIDFNGNTGPFIQYTHARIRSMIRKSVESNIEINTLTNAYDLLNNNEIEIIKIIKEYPIILENAAINHSPALVANYIFELAKEFNRFYQENPIFKEENESLRIIRLQLSKVCAEVISNGMKLLGIEVPERM
ncbi:MAG TPA: arginine--tRNA ligase [Bacteroidales bacterium]|nr:arginine--tRNA ligase [Bacteroidales bacterium]